MFFGEYLVTKRIINNEQLINGIITQLSSLPPFLKVLKESKKLDDSKIADIIFEQARQKSDLISIIKEKSLLSQGEITNLLLTQGSSRTPLGKVLIDLGYTDSKSIEKNLYDYLNVKDEESSPIAAEEVAEVVSKEESAPSLDNDISAAALESLKELDGIGQDELDALASGFSGGPPVEEVGALDVAVPEEIVKLEMDAESSVSDDSSTDVSSAALESLKELGISDEELSALSSGPEQNDTSAVTPDSDISSAALESLKELGISDEEISALSSGSEQVESSIIEVESNDSGVSSAALESLKELGISDDEISALSGSSKKNDNHISEGSSKEITGTFCTEFLNTFNEKKYNKFGKVIKMITDTANNGGDIANFFNSLYRDLHIIKGAACLSHAEATENLIGAWEDIVESLFKEDNETLKTWVNANTECLRDSINLLWDMRNHIEESQSESIFIDGSDSDRYKNLCEKVNLIKAA